MGREREDDYGQVEDETESQDEEEEEEEEAGTIEVPMQESIYDFIIVSGCLAGRRRTNLCFALTLGLFTMVLVLGLSGFLVQEVASDGIKDLVVPFNQFQDWRLNDGMLESFDRGTGRNRTWASFACGGEDWSWHSQTLVNYGGYTKRMGRMPISQGRFFGIVALVLWSALVVKECKMILHYACLLLLPTRTGSQDAYVIRNGAAAIEALPKWVKGAAGLLVFVRIVVIVVLGLNGLKFLSHTDNLKDFILNSLALGFIFDLDEMTFATFISNKHQKRLKALEPVKVSVNLGLARCIDEYSELTGFIFLVIIVTFAYHAYLSEFAAELLLKAFCPVCQGFPDVNTPQCTWPPAAHL